MVPQYGIFAGTYALAALLHARHPLQVVVTGAEGDAKAAELEKAAIGVYRFGKAVLRVTPERLAAGALPAALRKLCRISMPPCRKPSSASKPPAIRR